MHHIHHQSPQASAPFHCNATERDMHQKLTIMEVKGLKEVKYINGGVRKINLVF